MLLTALALTPLLLSQGAARAAAQAKAQPLAPRRQLPPPIRASRKAAPMKAMTETKQRFARDPTSALRRCPDPGTVRDRERHFAALPLYLLDSPCAGGWI
jgi:hypothetical protein